MCPGARRWRGAFQKDREAFIFLFSLKLQITGLQILSSLSPCSSMHCTPSHPLHSLGQLAKPHPFLLVNCS